MLVRCAPPGRRDTRERAVRAFAARPNAHSSWRFTGKEWIVVTDVAEFALSSLATVVRIEKPWGYEEIFAVVQGRYVGKVLHIRAGEALSLQYHEKKEETVAVQSGFALLDIGPSRTSLFRMELSPGQTASIPSGVLHRIIAVSDVVLLEASTADPGWQADVVRLEDRYGRAVTA
ncbi:cupin [Saccharopolyspora sp. ASAGF58]|nr:cupin [Saccharopolyspora sp. ASAGF58]